MHGAEFWSFQGTGLAVYCLYFKPVGFVTNMNLENVFIVYQFFDPGMGPGGQVYKPVFEFKVGNKSNEVTSQPGDLCYRKSKGGMAGVKGIAVKPDP